MNVFSELKVAFFERLAANPTTEVARGRFFYDTSVDKIKARIASAWKLLAVQDGFGGWTEQQTFAVANGEAGPTDVTGMAFDAAALTVVEVDYGIRRQTDSANEQQKGKLHLIYDNVDLEWKMTEESHFEDTGVTFSIVTVAGVGQVKYSSDSLAGGSYAGSLYWKASYLGI